MEQQQCSHLKNYNFDIVFIGANGVNEDGYSTPDPEEVIVKSEAIKRGKKVYFLCDHSKFKENSFMNFASLEDGTLITDGNIPKELEKIRKERRKKMIYTVTLNPAIDYYVVMKDFHEGNLNQAEEGYTLPGGKGINVSKVLKNFGKESVALGFVGGFTGVL